MDLLGALCVSLCSLCALAGAPISHVLAPTSAPAEDFVVSGNNTDALLGVCESMYRPGLQPEELFETISQCLLSAVNRDCLSGWGGVVHVITKTEIITRTLRGRMD
jgi:20S proteasome subunit beta 3